MLDDNNKFFRYVWRFNGLAVAGATVLCLLLGVFVAVKIFKDETGERHVTNVVNVGEQEKVKNEFVLGYPYTIAGTDYTRVPLYRDQSYDMSYYLKSSGGNEVNYLFLNNRTGESKWLLQTTNQLFISDIVISEELKKSNDGSEKAVGIMFSVVEIDTNKDGRLSEKDTIAIASSSIDGTGYKKLIENIDRLYAFKQIADDKIIILYQRNNETISEVYETPSMKKLSQNTIPKVNLE
jgi:hypothetical protein